MLNTQLTIDTLYTCAELRVLISSEIATGLLLRIQSQLSGVAPAQAATVMVRVNQPQAESRVGEGRLSAGHEQSLKIR